MPVGDDGKGKPNRLCEAKRACAWVTLRGSVCLDLRCVGKRGRWGQGTACEAAEAGRSLVWLPRSLYLFGGHEEPQEVFKQGRDLI